MSRVLVLVALLLAAAQAGAQEFGRLFFTPEQRAALDARRKARVPDKPAAVTVVSPTTRLDGFVKRSGGPSTVFVDGEAQTEGGADSPRLPRRPGDSRVSVPVGESGMRVELKPGEVLDRGSGEVRDVIGDGQVKVRPGAPAR
ncbi:MAG TPA: hypothetical protein VLW85_24030 [Myxococcales bacterium]|nr:hypothetical protein [Myxococcales bacterium]